MTLHQKKAELYRLNFEFFVRQGIHCETQDTLLVLTNDVKSKYQDQIDELHDECHSRFGNFVQLIARNNTCLDMDSPRVAVEYAGRGERPAVMANPNTTIGPNTVAYYDYFVYINCGVTGPSPLWAERGWTGVFLRELRDGVKMTGLSINCQIPESPHVQSMMYAMDREGLQTVVDGGALYDCTKNSDPFGLNNTSPYLTIILSYEVKMSELILQAGYGISSIVRPTTLFPHNISSCIDKDNQPLQHIWYAHRLTDYFGRIPSLDEVGFFKTSRQLPPDIAEVINYTVDVPW